MSKTFSYSFPTYNVFVQSPHTVTSVDISADDHFSGEPQKSRDSRKVGLQRDLPKERTPMQSEMTLLHCELLSERRSQKCLSGRDVERVNISRSTIIVGSRLPS